jgi:hypothetical protein
MHHRAFRVFATRAFERAHIVARRMGYDAYEHHFRFALSWDPGPCAGRRAGVSTRGPPRVAQTTAPERQLPIPMTVPCRDQFRAAETSPLVELDPGL